MNDSSLYLSEQQVNLIKKIPLFKGMSENTKENLLNRLDYDVSYIYKGDVIIKQNTPCLHMYILLEGKLEVNIIDAAGKNIKVETLLGPRSFATPHLFSEDNLFPATFTVIEPGILLKATKKSVFDVISSEPEVLKNFFRLTGNCNACTLARLKILSFKSIRSRLIYYIFENKIDTSNKAILQHNQTQLAEYISVSRPALANEIKKLIDEGLISVIGKEVTILNHNVLMQYL